MTAELVRVEKGIILPAIIAGEGHRASKRFLEFFTASIRNSNTRLSYMRAVRPFLAWCEERGLELRQVEPMMVAAYIERLMQVRAPQTVKQHLAAIRMLFDWLVTGQIVPFNPAASVKGPRYSIRKGKTPVLSAQETSHASLPFIVQVNEQVRPTYMICFDQSYHRRHDLKRREQLEKKREFLEGAGISSFYFKVRRA